MMGQGKQAWLATASTIQCKKFGLGMTCFAYERAKTYLQASGLFGCEIRKPFVGPVPVSFSILFFSVSRTAVCLRKQLQASQP